MDRNKLEELLFVLQRILFEFEKHVRDCHSRNRQKNLDIVFLYIKEADALIRVELLKLLEDAEDSVPESCSADESTPLHGEGIE